MVLAFNNPFADSHHTKDLRVGDSHRCRPGEHIAAFELAGPRNKVFFDQRTVGCGIVTCGGLCPGINNVVRGIVLEIARGYGVKRILGFRYGYEGLISRFGHEPVTLTPESVAHIHHQGGTIRAAMQFTAEIERRGLKIAVVGVPKTIDNDIHFISFS